jgi:hypothetical protein
LLVTIQQVYSIGKRVLARTVTALKRRPGLSLIGFSVIVMLAPLLPELPGVIPYEIRKAIGWTFFAIVLGVCTTRLFLVRQYDDRPLQDLARGPVDLYMGLLLAALCSILVVPLLQPGNLGFGDWDLFLGKIEAARRTVLLYGQFPWWDPWSRGGFPLAANPQCGVMGVAMPLVLAFGSSAGMALGTIACFLLAAEGTRRLARVWFDDPLAPAAAGLIYAINGGVLVASVAAYHVAMCYPSLPWMLLFIFRLDRSRSDGLWLGFWAAFSLLNGIQYFTAYTFLIASVVWLRVVRSRAPGSRVRVMEHSMLALGTFLALAGWRIATTGLVYHDFPRELRGAIDLSLREVYHALVDRHSAHTLKVMEAPYFWGTTFYIGPVVLVLTAISLTSGWRWWHTLTLVCGCLAVGSAHWYHPSYWLGHLPVFNTMHVVTRWGFMALLGVALSAASVLASWRASPRRSLRFLAWVALGWFAFDYLTYGFEILPVAFSVSPEERLFPGPPLELGTIVQVQEAGGFAAISRGYGVIQGFEPLMGYDRRAHSTRLWHGHPSYVAEFWTNEGPVRPQLWTPNHIVLSVAPGQEVFINQNPGSWWWSNGAQAFPGTRCAEMQEDFRVRAGPAGEIVLEIRPRGLKFGLLLHLAGIVLIAVILGLEMILRRIFVRRMAVRGVLGAE